MSLFQCENCGCVENTGSSSKGFTLRPHLFDWSYNASLKGMMICSACGPSHYHSGNEIKNSGKWHNFFERTFLPKGMFITNREGEIEHKDTGETDYYKYEIKTK